MAEVTDMDLVREYCARQSEPAFETLVHRHVNLVYSTALRQVGNPAQAEEITQAVFVILARKAARLRPQTVLAAWLHETARYVAASFLRGEIRRRRREQEAYMQSTLQPSSDDSAWEQLAPLLDEAIGRLRTADRNVVVLRYFQNKSAKEIAAALNIGEAAAKKRLTRAVEALRLDFFKRGFNVSTAALSGAVMTHSVQVAPAALANTVTAVALAKGATASTSTLTLIKGALKIMAWTKAKSAIVVGAGLLLTAGTTTVTVKEIQRHENSDAQWDIGRIDSRILETAPRVVKIIPSKFPNQMGWASIDDGRILGLGETGGDMVQAAYGSVRTRTILTTQLPQGKFDFIANLPSGSGDAFRQAVEKQFGVTTRRETIETNVLFLQVRTSNAPGLRPTSTRNSSSSRSGWNQFSFINQKADSIASFVEGRFGIPVIDQTGLTGSYDVNLSWNNRNDPQHENLKRALNAQLGLDLVPGTAPVEMLVVEKAD
jgi:uncharacterized protein (TIGR03435 family)